MDKIKTFEPKSFPVSSIDDVGEFVFENSDGNYMITGGSFSSPFGLGNGKAILLTVDENGNEISPKRYDLGGPKFTYCNYIIEVPVTKQYFVIGRILDEPTNRYKIFLNRLDASGNEVSGFPQSYHSTNNFSTGGGFMFYSDNNQNLTLIGSEFTASDQCDAGMVIMKCDLNGKEIQGSRKSILMNTGRDFKSAIKDSNNDYFYILGQKRDCNQSADTDVFLTKITETGEILLSPIYFGDTARDDARGFYITNQQEIVFLTSTDKGPGKLNIKIFKTDLQGQIIMGTDTTIGISNSVINPFSMQKTSDGGCIIAAS